MIWFDLTTIQCNKPVSPFAVIRSNILTSPHVRWTHMCFEDGKQNSPLCETKFLCSFLNSGTKWEFKLFLHPRMHQKGCSSTTTMHFHERQIYIKMGISSGRMREDSCREQWWWDSDCTSPHSFSMEETASGEDNCEHGGWRGPKYETEKEDKWPGTERVNLSVFWEPKLIEHSICSLGGIVLF